MSDDLPAGRQESREYRRDRSAPVRKKGNLIFDKRCFCFENNNITINYVKVVIDVTFIFSKGLSPKEILTNKPNLF